MPACAGDKEIKFDGVSLCSDELIKHEIPPVGISFRMIQASKRILYSMGDFTNLLGLSDGSSTREMR